MKAKFVFVTLLAVVLCISSCTSKPESEKVLPTPVIISRGDFRKTIQTRIENSKNDLSVSIIIEDVKISMQKQDLLDPHTIDLLINFKNVSSKTIVFKKPVTYGFGTEFGSSDDIRIKLERTDNLEVLTAPTSYSLYPTRVVHQVVASDFIQLGPGDVFSFQVEVGLPLMYNKDMVRAEKLASGKYRLTLMYANLDIGYDLPVEGTPVDPLDSPAELDEWIDTHFFIADLSAWIGREVSNTVEFVIPPE